MSSNALTVQIQGANGPQAMEVTQFLNNGRIAGALTQPVAPGFMRVPQAIRINPEDTFPVGGGKVALLAPVYAKIAAAAGINFVQSNVEYTDVNGEPGAVVTVWGTRTRPGLPALIRCGSVSCSYEQFLKRRNSKSAADEANLRYFMTRQLETAAKSRVTRELLGEPANYDLQDLQEAHGLFLVFADVADPSDADTRKILIQQSTGAALDLYGIPANNSGTELPQPAGVEVAEPHELGGAAEGESGAHAAGGADPFVDSSSDGDPSAAPAIESLDLPAWTKSCATDQMGEPQWETIPVEQLKAAVRARLKELAYDYKADPANLVEAGMAKQWSVVADKLLTFERTGGGANA